MVNSVAGKVDINGSKAVSELDKKADKLERVARNSPSKRNQAQANEARKKVNKPDTRNEGGQEKQLQDLQKQQDKSKLII